MSGVQKKLVMVASDTEAVVCISGGDEPEAVRFLVAPRPRQVGDEGVWEAWRKCVHIFACQLTMLLVNQIKQFDCTCIDVFATPAVRQQLTDLGPSTLKSRVFNFRNYSENTLPPELLKKAGANDGGHIAVS